MIPGKIIRINDKVTFKLWPKLEGKVIKNTSSYSIKLKPMTVSPHYPHPHPNQLEPVLPERVITMFPLPKPTNIEEAEEEAEEDSVTSHYSSCSRDEDWEQWEGSSLSTESEDTYSSLNRSTILAKETQYWDLAPPAPPQWRSLRADWRYCPTCQNPHPAGELSRLLCVEVGLAYMEDCDGPTVEVGRKRKRED